jgi:hypothetical protein
VRDLAKIEPYEKGKVLSKEFWSEKYHATVMKTSNLRELDNDVKKINRHQIYFKPLVAINQNKGKRNMYVI